MKIFPVVLVSSATMVVSSASQGYLQVFSSLLKPLGSLSIVGSFASARVDAGLNVRNPVDESKLSLQPLFHGKGDGMSSMEEGGYVTEKVQHDFKQRDMHHRLRGNDHPLDTHGRSSQGDPEEDTKPVQSSFTEISQHRSLGLATDDLVTNCTNLQDLRNSDDKCERGLEFGQRCKHNKHCFTASCGDESKCDCPDGIQNCQGCTNPHAACIRVEQMHTYVPMEICQLLAYERSSPKKFYQMFSSGGSRSHNFVNLQWMSIASTELQLCSTFFAYDGDAATDIRPHVAFAQSNINAQNVDDIGKITLLGSYEGLIDASLWLSGDWVKQLDMQDLSTSGLQQLEAAIWPRVEVDSMEELLTSLSAAGMRNLQASDGIMYVLHVNDNEYLNFSVPEHVGVELIGTKFSDATDGAGGSFLTLEGTVNVEGRLSCKNLLVNFNDGVMDIHPKGSVIFQSSNLFNLDRCPPRFNEIDGLCLYAGDMFDKAEDALENCRGYDDLAFVPELSDLSDPANIADTIMLRGISAAWIESSLSDYCAVLYADGTASEFAADSDDCSQYLFPLCATYVKESIIGRNYTSYFSNQNFRTLKLLFDRLVDEDRLPIQLGSSLTVLQTDYSPTGEDYFTMSDERPSSVLVEVVLKHGNKSDIVVALENFPFPATSNNTDEWLFDQSLSSLPTKIQVHATDTVCVERVDLLFRNETDYAHVAISLPASIFADCLDFNVCSESNKDSNMCGRSLAYYNETENCLELRTDDALFPRDLSLDLYATSCQRLTTWNHPEVGEPIKIEIITHNATTSQNIRVKEITSDAHDYVFVPQMTSLDINEDSRLPFQMRVDGGDGAQLEKLKITRYGLDISYVDFRANYECIYLCDEIASHDGVSMESVETLYLSLLQPIECKKVDYILIDENGTTGRDICTMPAINVTTFSDLQGAMDLITNATTPFRSVDAFVHVSTLAGDNGELSIPSNRGLNLYVDRTSTSGQEAVIEDFRFNVAPTGELLIDGFSFTGTSKLTIQSDGELEVKSCTIISAIPDPFLSNAGSTLISSTVITESTILSNTGFLDLSYVTFLGASNVLNDPLATIRVSRLNLYEDFVILSNLPGTIKLPDAERLYTIVDDDDPRCLGDYFPNSTVSLELTTSECKAACEDSFICSGYISSIEEETLTSHCALCEQEDACVYDCAGANKQYALSTSKFFYVKVDGCLRDTRFLAKVIMDATLEECKLYCQYYDSCEGFKIEGSSTCQMISDLDFDGSCVQPTTVYIPFLPNNEKYLQVNGTYTASANIIATHEGLSPDECASMCTKTLLCVSFIVSDEQPCQLYDSNSFQRSANIFSSADSLFITVNKLFPLKKYMTVGDACLPISSAMKQANTKIIDRCQDLCNDDESCAGYSFKTFVNLTMLNCALYDRTSLIDSVSVDTPHCSIDLSETIRVAYVDESFAISSGRVFEDVDVPDEDMLQDECKNLCFADSDCVSYRYDASSFQCSIGKLSSGVVGLNSTQAYYSLSAKSPDILATYLPIYTCYAGEAVASPNISSVDTSESYIKFARTCMNPSNTTMIETGLDKSPAECGLACNRIGNCIGFTYYVDYGGMNNVGKIDTCDLFSGDILFSDCDAVEENSDVYLRAEYGNTCQTLCDVDELCTSYVFDDEVGCLLYSDIALLDQCDVGSTARLVNVGQGHRERDALVGPLTGMCFIDFEDTREIGCFSVNGINFVEDTISVLNSTTDMTPFRCQDECKQINKAYYLVLEDQCYCSSVAVHKDLSAASNCNTPCSGDSTQMCGSFDSVLVGETNLPLFYLTLGQCKRACDESSDCLAISFDSTASPSKCELRSSALYDACEPSSSSSEIYVDHLEHYYDTPTTSYIGSSLLFLTTTALRVECQSLCDAFLLCESIRFHDSTNKTVNNCEILGGDVVSVASENETDVQVARGTTRFTAALSTSDSFTADPDALLGVIPNIFDLDECQSLCDLHARCGSLVFGMRTCTLYKSSGFAAGVSGSGQSSTPYYTTYEPFVSVDQDFVEATDLCIEDQNYQTTPLESRATTRSKYDCALRCNRITACKLFTFDESNQKDCTLWGDEARLEPCSLNPSTLTYAMFTMGSFSTAGNLQYAKLKDETSLSVKIFDQKSIAECAALCDEWFGCSSFRADDASGSCRLYESEQYESTDAITLSSAGLIGSLYTYYSESSYVKLPSSYCVPAISFISVVSNAPLESCKIMCDKIPTCLSFEHDQDGTCSLYSSSDFSATCSAEQNRALYIGYAYLFADDREQFSYKELNNCFDSSQLRFDLNMNLTDCQASCSVNTDCFGVQHDAANQNCTYLEVNLPDQSPSCGNEVAYLRIEVDPYREMENTCLRNTIVGDPITDTEEYECQALCDSHPQCRYFLYGSDPTRTEQPVSRECVLFEGQPQELDDCQDFTSSYKFYKLRAIVNGRTFIDQITWFGEPEETFAVLGGLSYSECASLCEELGDNCAAFVHSWNYRSAPTALSPLIWTRKRLIMADFSSADPDAKFLWFDGELLVKPLDQSSDDTLKTHSIILENSVDGDGPTFKLKFNDGYCISAPASVSEYQVTDSFILDVLNDNSISSSPIPACQALGLGDCDGSSVIVFSRQAQDGRLSLSYDMNTTGLDGCLRVRPRSSNGRDWEATGSPQTMYVKPIVECTSSPTTRECNESESLILYELPNGTSIYTAWSSNNACNTFISGTSTKCTTDPRVNLTSEYVKYSETTVCESPPLTNCLDPVAVSTSSLVNATQVDIDGTNFTIPGGSNVTFQERICVMTSDINTTMCNTTQLEGLDILEEIWNDFSAAVECNQSSSSYDLVISSSYGDGCSFVDETLVDFPRQLWAFTSDPVLLQNNEDATCLSVSSDPNPSLEMVACTNANAKKWMYIFEGGELFYTNQVDGTGGMNCLTHTANGLSISQCDSLGTSGNQSWTYNSVSSTVELGSTNTCLLVNSTTHAIVVGDCSLTEARWSQYSECRLNTRERTAPMKLERFDSSSRCLNGEGNGVVACGSAPEWRYYYDENDFRLQKEGSPECYGRNFTDLNITAAASPTGISPCPDLEYSAYYALELDGDENNQFKWTQYGFGGDSDKEYCVRADQKTQVECRNLTSARRESWRKYGSSGDATEISVKPGLILQQITDPEKLLQFWLMTADGRDARLLRAKMAKLTQKIEQAVPIFDNSNTGAEEVLKLVTAVQEPVSSILGSMNQAESFFGIVAIVLFPLEFVPYVGPFLKGIRLRFIANQVKSAFNKGTYAVDKVDQGVSAAMIPIETYMAAVYSARDAMVSIPYVARGAVAYATTNAYYAFQSGNINEYNRMQTSIRIMTKSVDAALTAISTVEQTLNALDRIKSFISGTLFATFKVFRSIFSVIDKVIDALFFINILGSFKLTIGIPSIKIDFKFLSKFKISFKWINPKDFGLADIGMLLDMFERVLRSIPGVGFLWDLLNDMIAAFLSAIFKFLPFSVPEFGISIDPLNEAIASVTNAVKSLVTFGDTFDNLIDFGNLDFVDTIAEAGEFVANKMEEALPDLSGLLSCTDPSCIFPEEFPLKIHGAEADNIENITLPTVEISGTNYSVPEEVQDIIKGFIEIGDDITSTFSQLFGSASCDSYETVSGIQPLGMMAATLGMSPADMGLEDPRFSVRVCSDMKFSNFNSISGDVMELIANMVFVRRRRRLGLDEHRELTWEQTYETPRDFLSQEICGKTAIGPSWGISIPWRSSPEYFGAMRKYFAPGLFDGVPVPELAKGILEFTTETAINQLFPLEELVDRILYWSWFRGSTGINSPPFKMKIPGSGSLDLFNIATNLVIGCDTTDAANPEKSVFQVKMTFGPMFSLTMPAAKNWNSQWRPTKVTEKYHESIVTETSKEKFDSEIQTIAQWDEYVCNIKFIEATYRGLDKKAKDPDYMKSIEWMKKKIIQMRNKFATLIGVPDYFDPDSIPMSIYEVFEFDRLSNKAFYPDDAQAPKFIKEVKSAVRWALLYRAMLEVANGYACHMEQKGSLFNPKSWYVCIGGSRDFWREEVDHKCAGPIQTWQAVKGLIPGGKRLYLWEYFGQFGLHLTNYKNLFGAKLVIPLIKRTTITGKFIKKTSEIAIALKGPNYKFNTWASIKNLFTSFDYIREMNLIGWVGFLYDLVRDQFPGSGLRTESSVKNMVKYIIPDDKLDLAIAEKYESFRLTLKLFPVRMNLLDTETEKDVLDKCNREGNVCFSPGFTLCNFNADAPGCNRRLEGIDMSGAPERMTAKEAAAANSKEGMFEVDDDFVTAMMSEIRELFADGEDLSEIKNLLDEELDGLHGMEKVD